MPLYYDLEHMDLSNSESRALYVPRYGIKLVLTAYRAVAERATGSPGEDLPQELATTVAALLDFDKEVAAAPPQFKEELQAHACLQSNSPKERENLWQQALGYKEDIKDWNSLAPPTNDVPRRETDPVAWRHLKIRQHLFVERFPDKMKDDMPSHYQPSMVWPAYVALDLIHDDEFHDEAKTGTRSRVLQREDYSRPQKIRRKHSASNHHELAQTVLVQNRQQGNAEQLLRQKARELQKGESNILFDSSLALLVASKDGALNQLEPAVKASLLRQAGAGIQLSLQRMEDMVRNPWTYKFTNQDGNQDENNKEVQIILDPPEEPVYESFENRNETDKNTIDDGSDLDHLE